MPALEKAYREHQQEGLVIIGIGALDGMRPVMGFAASMGVTFPVVWDGRGNVFTAYGVRGLPTTYFISRAGTIEKVVFGGVTSEQLEQEIDQLLQQ